VLAIEMLTACQAISIREGNLENRKMGEGTDIFYNLIREQLEIKENDHLISDDIQKTKNIIQDGKFQTSLNNYLHN
jgi:histidine ammonia-lyase